MRNQFSIVRSYDIDKQKWDDCIGRSANALIYGTSWWLDHLCDNWTGIIMNDYEAVMPVPWRKKWGITYQYHVPFTQQLGIFFHNELTEIEAFSEAILKVCRYGKYPFNYLNPMAGAEHVNYVLPLESNYENKFEDDVVQNIRRAQHMNLQYRDGEIKEAIEVYKQLYGQRSGITEDQYKKFEKLCFFIGENEKMVIRKVVDRNEKLLAIALLPVYKKRMYNILNSTFPEGKKCEANYLLLAEIWKEFSDSEVLFDFEGSDIPGVKAFYKKFGAVNQPYVRWHFNRLPWLVKLLKK